MEQILIVWDSLTEVYSEWEMKEFSCCQMTHHITTDIEHFWAATSCDVVC